MLKYYNNYKITETKLKEWASKEFQLLLGNISSTPINKLKEYPFLTDILCDEHEHHLTNEAINDMIVVLKGEKPFNYSILITLSMKNEDINILKEAWGNYLELGYLKIIDFEKINLIALSQINKAPRNLQDFILQDLVVFMSGLPLRRNSEPDFNMININEENEAFYIDIKSKIRKLFDICDGKQTLLLTLCYLDEGFIIKITM